MKYFIIIVSLMALCLSGCDSTSSTGPTSSGTVFLWIGADKDSYIWYQQPDNSFGQQGYLPVAYGHGTSADVKKSFVHYHLPILPEGTEILEAYMELYHPGANEDGKTDDLDIDVQRVYESWDPEVLNWNNQPSFSPSAEFQIQLRSQAWCTSSDIKGIVEDMFDDPDNYHGFEVFWLKTSGLVIEKGFSSNNYDRTADDMKKAPRLLVKIQLPSGKTTNDISLPALSADNDLDFPAGTNILMLRFSGGSSWPDDWEVVVDE